MSVGFGQFILVGLAVLFLFGNLPKLRKDLSTGGVAAIQAFQKGLNQEKDPKDSTFKN